MRHQILAILLDSGDTLVDEGTEIKNDLLETQTASLIPGAAEMVQALKARGYRLALVADGPAKTFTNVLGHYGLYHLFDALAISGDVGVEKPHPQMFFHALDCLNLDPMEYGRVLMVGNNLERDIAGANALGIVTVWIDWAPRRSKIPAGPHEIPCYTIKQPLDLLDLLNRLERECL